MKRALQLISILCLSLFGKAQTSKVLILDCKFRDVVYDNSIYAVGGSNATEIARIIRSPDYEVRIMHTSGNWLNNSNILTAKNYEPDLLIIHTSAFFNPLNPTDLEVYTRLIDFLSEFSEDYPGKILIYSRFYNVVNGKMGLKNFILNRAPTLSNKLFLMDIHSFVESSQRIFLKNCVQNILD